MRLIFVLFFNILSYNHLFSQNIISGNIVDESNEPLIGINIFSSDILLRFGITNLFDTHYRTFASGISAPGRSFQIGLNFKL